MSCDQGSSTKTYRILQEMHSVDCSCRDSVKHHTVCIQKACSTIGRVHLMISCVLSRPVLLLSLKTHIICMSFAMICEMTVNFWTLTVSHLFPIFSLKPRKVGAPPLENCGPVISSFCCASWSTSAQRWISQGQWGETLCWNSVLVPPCWNALEFGANQIEWLDCEFQRISDECGF